MDAVGSALVTEILKSIGEGNAAKGLFLVGIFVVIWIEVRGVKKQIRGLNDTVAKGFKEGEHRFEAIETKQLEFEHRMTMIESRPQTHGG